MKHGSRFLLLFVLAALAFADVRTEEKTHVQFAGMIGKMMNFFGGKAAKEGVVSTVALKGNRKMTANDRTAQIIDLDEEKIYDIDLKGKSYKVTTFAEMRRRMEEEAAKAKAEAEKQQTKKPEEQSQQKPEFDIDFSIKESGQRRNLLGYDCREVVMTVAVRQKGKSLEEAGGMVMTNNLWLGPNIPALKELADFDMRYAQKLWGGMDFGESMQQMAMAIAMYPGFKEAMERMQKENVNMDGAQLLSVTTMQAVKSQAQAAEEAKQQQEQEKDDTPASIGGFGGLLGKKLAKKMAAKKQEESAQQPEPAGRSTIFTSEHELRKVDTTVSDADVAIPAGFKQKG